MQYEQKENKPKENYVIVPMNLTVDVKIPYGFEGGNNSSCISLPCRNCQKCQVCVGCKKMDSSLEERSEKTDPKKLFVELLAA